MHGGRAEPPSRADAGADGDDRGRAALRADIDPAAHGGDRCVAAVLHPPAFKEHAAPSLGGE